MEINKQTNNIFDINTEFTTSSLVHKKQVRKHHHHHHNNNKDIHHQNNQNQFLFTNIPFSILQNTSNQQQQQKPLEFLEDEELSDIINLTATTIMPSSTTDQQQQEKSRLLPSSSVNHDDDEESYNTTRQQMPLRTPMDANTLSNTNNGSNPASPSAAGNNNNFLTEEEMHKHIRAKTSLIIAIVFCVIFMVVELVSGIIAHSLAIMTDAAHMLTDVGSLALSLFAVIASQWQASDQFTFGFKRAEVVGALFSIMMVWGLVGVIMYEGVMRLITIVQCAQRLESQYTECEGTKPRLMLIVGCLGLVVNIGYAIILAWGGAEVKHAHSHGGDDDHDHGHSHGGHGHSHGGGGGHGHSHGGGASAAGGSGLEDEVEKVNCCEPSPEELSCSKLEHGHDHLKKKKVKNGMCTMSNDSFKSPGSVVCMKTAPNMNDCGDHGHDHGHSHGEHDDHHDHGHSHSHGHGDDHDHDHHGHSHGGGGHDGNEDDKKDQGLHANHVNMNIKGAAVHALGDCLQSIGVIIAAGIIWGGCGVEGDARSYFNVADPGCSLLFAVITLWTTKSLFVEVFGILMERAPRGVHVTCIKRKFEHFQAIVEVKDIFIWSITNDRTALGAHVVVSRNATPDEIFRTLDSMRHLCLQLGFCMSAIEVLRDGDESAIKYKSTVTGNNITSNNNASSPTNAENTNTNGNDEAGLILGTDRAAVAC